MGMSMTKRVQIPVDDAELELYRSAARRAGLEVGMTDILSYDAGFDVVPWVRRITPPATG